MVEFEYNNGQQATIGMSLFEALYGKRCITPVSWYNLASWIVLGPEMLQQMEQEIFKIR